MNQRKRKAKQFHHLKIIKLQIIEAEEDVNKFQIYQEKFK